MAPVVTTGVLIVETFLTLHPCAGGHVNLSVSFHGRSTTNCACHPCAKAMQFSPYCNKEPCKSFNQYLHFLNYACQPCTGAMQILFKSLACHPNRGPCCSSSSKKKCVRVILARRAMQNFSAQNKRCNRFHVEEKIVILAQGPQ